MELFLCANNISLKYVLCSVKEMSPEKAIVFTDQPNIYQFFNYLAIENLECFFIESSVRLYDFCKLYRLRKKVKKILKQEKNFNHVHMYHQAFGGLYNWIITYCHSLYVPITYHRTVAPLNMPKVNYSFPAIKAKILYRLCYSTSIDTLNNGRGISPKLAKSFYHKNNIEEVIAKEDKQITSIFAKIIIEKIGLAVNKKSVLLLTGCVVDCHLVDVQEYRNKISSLICSLQDVQIICKCHPRFTDETEDEKSLPHIPSFIPINILLTFFPVVIGYSSYALLEAFQENVKSISLLEYFRPVSIAKKEIYKNYLGERICYPKSIDEIIHLVK